MSRFLAILVISLVVLSGCGGKRGSPPPGASSEVNPLIPEKTSILRKDKSEKYFGTPVDNVVSMSIEKIPSGAIIHVIGVTRLQGAYDVRLTSDSKGDPVDGVLTFTLKAVQPLDQPQGPQRTRTVHVGRFISNGDLKNSSLIRIVGGQNVISKKL
jgi:hypothetical protein